MASKWSYADKWYVAVSGIVAMMIMLSLCFLFVTQQPVPDVLLGMAWVLLGHFFGSQAQKFVNGRNHKANAKAAFDAQWEAERKVS